MDLYIAAVFLSSLSGLPWIGSQNKGDVDYTVADNTQNATERIIHQMETKHVGYRVRSLVVKKIDPSTIIGTRDDLYRIRLEKYQETEYKGAH